MYLNILVNALVCDVLSNKYPMKKKQTRVFLLLKSFLSELLYPMMYLTQLTLNLMKQVHILYYASQIN
jgi:hypothetical protein